MPPCRKKTRLIGFSLSDIPNIFVSLTIVCRKSIIEVVSLKEVVRLIEMVWLNEIKIKRVKWCFLSLTPTKVLVSITIEWRKSIIEVVMLKELVR